MFKSVLGGTIGVFSFFCFHMGDCLAQPPAETHYLTPSETLCSTTVIRGCYTFFGNMASNTCDGICEVGAASCLGKKHVFVFPRSFNEQIGVPPRVNGKKRTGSKTEVVCVEQSKCETCVVNPNNPATGICDQEVWWPLEVAYTFILLDNCRL